MHLVQGCSLIPLQRYCVAAVADGLAAIGVDDPLLTLGVLTVQVTPHAGRDQELDSKPLAAPAYEGGLRSRTGTNDNKDRRLLDT